VSMMQAAPPKAPDPKTLELQRAHLENQRRIIQQFDEIQSKMERNYHAMTHLTEDADAVLKRQQWTHGMIIFGISILLIQVYHKWRVDRRQEVRFKAMIAHSETLLEIASAHGKVTDAQKDRTVRAGDKVERAGQAVAVASVKAARVAKVAAEKADIATRKAEEAVVTIDERMEAIGAEVHAMKEQINELLARLLPEGGKV
jgi:hypothetical protein